MFFDICILQGSIAT